MIASAVIPIWLWGLFSLGVIAGWIYLLYEWYERAWVYDPAQMQAVFDPDFGLNVQTWLLIAGVVLLIWSLAGAMILGWIFRSLRSGDRPPSSRASAVRELTRPDGSVLHVEMVGPEDAPPIVLTHGWGMNNTEWNYLKEELGDRFRLIAWDLPGLGRSRRPQNNDYSMEKLAHDLEAVLGCAGGRPALLMGHSIGGMITLTFCRLFPEALGREVCGLALVHTTYTNPVRTTSNAGLLTALERPLIVPLLHLTIWLSPLVWLMTLLSYLNGSSHISTKLSGFAGTETWEQVEFATRFQLQAPPAVLARGMFGMLNYDATETLSQIDLPTMVVAADQDPVCKPEASHYMHIYIPAAQLETLSPARHMGLVEYHKDFAALVTQWRQKCG